MKELFKSGVSFRTFMLNMDKDIRSKFMKYYIPVTIKEEYKDKVSLINKKVSILGIVEGWCPDCHINLSILEKLIAPNRNIELKLILKADVKNNLHEYEVEGKLKVPTFLFMNEEMKECGMFIEQPKILKNSDIDTVEGSKLMMMYKAGRLTDEIISDLISEMQKTQ